MPAVENIYVPAFSGFPANIFPVSGKKYHYYYTHILNE
jgi:hypothetical protein